MSRSCLLVGATGLVGGHLLSLLDRDQAYDRIVVLTRRRMESPSPKVTAHEVDLGDPETYRSYVGVDDVYCCLGTTIKKAGSKAQFRRVDHDYPIDVGRTALAAGAQQYIIVTAVGADARSSVFYNQVKGEVETTLRALAFPHGVKIIRPSMLLGNREESRPAEHIGGAIMRFVAPAFAGPLKRYRAIEASDVAAAMHQAGRFEPNASATYEGEELFRLVRQSADVPHR